MWKCKEKELEKKGMREKRSINNKRRDQRGKERMNKKKEKKIQNETQHMPEKVGREENGNMLKGDNDWQKKERKREGEKLKKVEYIFKKRLKEVFKEGNEIMKK